MPSAHGSAICQSSPPHTRAAHHHGRLPSQVGRMSGTTQRLQRALHRVLESAEAGARVAS